MVKRIITLGTWEGRNIEWIVVKSESFGSLVVSKDNLFNSRFADNTNEWRKSYICKYLNSEFFNSAFSYKERKQIVNVFLEDENTKCDVFLLNIEEAKLLGDNSKRSEISSVGWWLRTIREYSTLWGVDTDGCIDRSFGYWDIQGVHPAMYIREK